MVRRFAAAVILTAVLFLSACGGASSVPTRPSSGTMSAVAHAYVDESTSRWQPTEDLEFESLHGWRVHLIAGAASLTSRRILGILGSELRE